MYLLSEYGSIQGFTSPNNLIFRRKETQIDFSKKTFRLKLSENSIKPRTKFKMYTSLIAYYILNIDIFEI